MNDWKLPWQGGCRCGQTRIRVTAAPLLASACHCTGCQRMTASAFSLTLTLPAAGFEVVVGEPVIGGLHGATRHHFCPYCMSWMFTRPAGMDEFVNLRPSVTFIEGARWEEIFGVRVSCRRSGLADFESQDRRRFDGLPVQFNAEALSRRRMYVAV